MEDRCFIRDFEAAEARGEIEWVPAEEIRQLMDRAITRRLITPLRLRAFVFDPSPARVITLECISNEVGGCLMGNAVWRGVPLHDLLTMAGVSPQAVDLVLRAADDYSDSIPVERALNPAAMLAYEMNGETLAPAHGFPVRLLVPGIYGMKNVKWPPPSRAKGECSRRCAASTAGAFPKKRPLRIPSPTEPADTKGFMSTSNRESGGAGDVSFRRG